MKIESPSYTEDTYHDVMGGYLERERAELIRRLRAIADAVEPLAAEIDGARSEDGPWTPVETLAHIASSAPFFGWVVHEIASGKDVSGQMLDLMRARDPAIDQAAAMPAAELAAQVRATLERTIAFLADVPYDDLRNAVTFAGRRLTAEDFARISMVHHFEDHVEQMRSALRRS